MFGKPRAIKPVVGSASVRPASPGPGASICPAGQFLAGVAVLVSGGGRPPAFREVAVSLFRIYCSGSRASLVMAGQCRRRTRLADHGWARRRLHWTRQSRLGGRDVTCAHIERRDTHGRPGDRGVEAVYVSGNDEMWGAGVLLYGTLLVGHGPVH